MFNKQKQLKLIVMKKITIILILAIAAIFTSCEGPMGPPGFDGQDGGLMLASVFEIQDDFTSSNDYKLYFEFPSTFEIYDTDVVLVYILWDQADGLDIWRLMPQTAVLPNGVIQYNFDYTVADVQIYLDFTIPENDLDPVDTDNQIFRIAVIPADFAAKKSVDLNDFNSILGAPELKLTTVKDVGFVNSLK